MNIQPSDNFMYTFLNIAILFISLFIYIEIFSRRRKTRMIRTLMLIVVNAGMAFVAYLLPVENERMSSYILPVILFVVMNVLAIRKIIRGNEPDQEILNKWHDDPSNWKAGVFYFNPKDKRLLPPKRLPGLGWTINFANPFSVLLVIGIIILIILFAELSEKYF